MVFRASQTSKTCILEAFANDLGLGRIVIKVVDISKCFFRFEITWLDKIVFKHFTLIDVSLLDEKLFFQLLVRLTLT